MAAIGNTELVASKNDLIVSLVQRELISRAVIMPSIMDASAYANKGSKSIAIPRAGSFSVEDRATATQASLVGVTYATDSITLDQMSTVSWVVDPQDEIESAVEVEADLAQRAARAHAKNFDAKVLAGIEAAATATATAGDITKDVVLEMRETLLSAEADPSQLYLLVGPDQEAKLLGITEFVEAQKYGSSAIPSGVLGTLYGVNVILSTQIGASTYYMYDRDGYGFAIQKQVSMDQRPAPEYGSGAMLRVMDMKWGHAQLQNGVLLLKDAN